MGSYQTKCGCGEINKVKITIPCSNEEQFLSISRITGGWSISPLISKNIEIDKCEKCAKELGDKLDELDEIDDYVMTKYENGLWRTDLP